MIDEKLLLAAGYRQYPPPQHDPATFCFEKRVRVGLNTLYFVHVRGFDLRRFAPERGIGWQAEANFTTSRGDTFSVMRPFSDDSPIEDAESFFQAVFDRMGCLPYEVLEA